jgi:hypothetical protein
LNHADNTCDIIEIARWPLYCIDLRRTNRIELMEEDWEITGGDIYDRDRWRRFCAGSKQIADY